MKRNDQSKFEVIKRLNTTNIGMIEFKCEDFYFNNKNDSLIFAYDKKLNCVNFTDGKITKMFDYTDIREITDPNEP